MTRSIAELRTIARDLLRDHRIHGPPVPVEELAAKLGAEVKYSPYGGNLAGMVMREAGMVLIGVNSNHHQNRQRFTIAHEIAHLLFHQGKRVHIDRDFVEVNLRHPDQQKESNDPEEVEANRFAAELLMPYHMLDDELKRVDVEDENEIRRLAQDYQVSVQAMTIRVSALLKL